MAAKKRTRVRPTKHRAYHHGDLRRALLDAARVELHLGSVQQLSLRGVARRAGVTHTAAYHHFADKDALMRRLAQEGFEKLDASMVHEMADVKDPVDRLVAAGVGYLRFAADDPQALRLMFDGDKVVHEDDEPLSTAARRAFTRLVEATAAARGSRGLSGDPLPDAIMQWSAVHGFATLSRGKRLEFAGITDETELGRAMLERLETSLYRRTP